MLTPPPKSIHISTCNCFLHCTDQTYLVAFVEKVISTELHSLLIKLGENIVGFVEHTDLNVDAVMLPTLCINHNLQDDCSLVSSSSLFTCSLQRPEENMLMICIKILYLHLVQWGAMNTVEMYINQGQIYSVVL